MFRLSSYTSSSRTRTTLAAASLLLGGLLLWPLFATAQPAPNPIGPTPIPDPTATPSPKLSGTSRSVPSNSQPSAPTSPKGAPTKAPTVTAKPTATPHPSATPSPTPTKTPEKSVVGVDSSIRPQFEQEIVGEKIVNASGTNQRLAQSALQGTKNCLGFVIRFVNTGNSPVAFTLSAPTSGDGWLLRYFDVTESEMSPYGKAHKEVEITSGICSKGGWTTPVISAGQLGAVRLEVTRNTDHPGKAFRDLPVRVSATTNPKVTDVVVAGVGLQTVAGIEYSLDQGTTWKAAPLLEGNASASTPKVKASSGSSSLLSTVGIAVKEGQVIGLRAKKALPSLPWPFEPEMKPLWNDVGYWNVGETIWVQARASAQIVGIECGNTLHTRLFVQTDYALHYKLDLDIKRQFVHVGGGTAGETEIVATVLNEKGAPVPGVRVRFGSHYADYAPKDGSETGTTPAGTLHGDGPEHNWATTDKDGKATITLTSSEREAAVIVEAQLLLESVPEKDAPRFGQQLMEFFDEHPEPPADDDF